MRQTVWIAPRVTSAEKAMNILDRATEATNARAIQRNSGLAIQQLTALPCQQRRRRAQRVSTAPATAQTSTLSAPMAHTVQKDLSTKRLAHRVTSDRAERTISTSTLAVLDVEKDSTRTLRQILVKTAGLDMCANPARPSPTQQVERLL